MRVETAAMRWSRRGKVVRASLALALLLGAGPSDGQVVAPAGRTLFNRGVLLRSVLRYDTFAGSGPERWRSESAIVWGAYPHLSLALVLPVVRRESGPDPGRTRTGSGDATLFARYDALRRNAPAGATRLGPELGLKLPTGGAFGSGSTDLLAGLVFSHVRDPDWLVADAQYAYRTEGDGGLRAGDRWRVDLAYLRRVVPRAGVGVPMVLAVLELNAESAGRSRRAGVPLPDSGGDVVFLSPGVEVLWSRRLVLEAAAPVRILEDLNGGQPRPEVSAILGIRWLF